MRRTLSLILAAVMLLAMLCACSVNDEAGGSQADGAAQGPNSGQEGGQTAAPVDRSDIYVGVSINALDAINNQQTYNLMQQKCEGAGFRYAATNANGDTDGLTGAIQEAVSKGVRVISVESGYIDGISAYFAKNDFSLGAAMYMMLASEMGYAGKIIATGHTGHPAIRARVNVQEAMLKEYTGIECVTFITTGYPGTTELAYNGCETALQQHPDVETIWCTFDLEALGAARACEDLGVEDVKIVGADGELDVLYMIRDEKYIIATSVADLESTTDDVIATIEELADTGDTEMFHEMPYIFITKENVDSYIEQTEAYLNANG